MFERVLDISLKIIRFSAGIYLLKLNSRNNSTRCGTYSKLTIKTPNVTDVVLVSLLLTLSKFLPAGWLLWKRKMPIQQKWFNSCAHKCNAKFVLYSSLDTDKSNTLIFQQLFLLVFLNQQIAATLPLLRDIDPFVNGNRYYRTLFQ